MILIHPSANLCVYVHMLQIRETTIRTSGQPGREDAHRHKSEIRRLSGTRTPSLAWKLCPRQLYGRSRLADRFWRICSQSYKICMSSSIPYPILALQKAFNTTIVDVDLPLSLHFLILTECSHTQDVTGLARLDTRARPNDTDDPPTSLLSIPSFFAQHSETACPRPSDLEKSSQIIQYCADWERGALHWENGRLSCWTG